MKHIYLNLKRFDVPVKFAGVNRLAAVDDWAKQIIESVEPKLKGYNKSDVDFSIFFPEMHLLGAMAARGINSPIKLGCQSVYHEDIIEGQNFGAFTSNRPAAAMKAIGCDITIIGHCEERNGKSALLLQAGIVDDDAVNGILNKQIKCALAQDMKVLYCIGEKEEEQVIWQETLSRQLEIGLSGVDTTKIVIAYEPIWSIGPGKKPADKDYITKVARFIKEKTKGLDVVYGGGLKKENAAMLAAIPEIDGGLIALTRFQGEIGFYPDEYLEIIRLYMSK